MKFPDPLIPGTLVRRYKRFLSDVEIKDGAVVTAHCPNPGSMLSVDEPGSRVWLSPSRNPERKLRYTWELIDVAGQLVGINTFHPNGLVAAAVAEGAVSELGGYASIRREVRYGQNSRIDLLLEGDGRPPCYVEIKNVTMRRGRDADAPAEFPDSVTARGTKHLGELAEMVRQGGRAVMFYLVQRGDCRQLAIAADIDPQYAEAYSRAVASGVEVVCYGCRLTPDEITLSAPLAIA
ncbi:MAG: DNA/RNA nuclease SfsA [Rhodospirillales bacterium]|jgi:sugar fermentation stimulation protein A|nr:DNA/RNA nuclease SfsA [Rhodospirillales bacterium]MDP6805092.1 DNA/RNA nuclease SfsA [Rhodospirillales bacterium]